jgi:hypothetical protein
MTMCRVCGMCKTCAASNSDHECPYPNCDDYHRCPPKTEIIPFKRPRGRKPKVAKSARDSESEASDRDMEVKSSVTNLKPVVMVSSLRQLPVVSKPKRLYPKCPTCGHLQSFHKDGQCRMRLRSGACSCPKGVNTTHVPDVTVKETEKLE